MKLKLGLIVFLFVCLVVGSSVFAEEFKKALVGDWNVPANWVEGTIPSGSIETKIRYSGTICTLNSVENWAYTTMNEMRVYNYGVLNIVAGGSLTGPSWFRVGAANPGTVNQSGGTLTLKAGPSNSKLVIGDSGSSNGLYNMTGGTITYATGEGQLIIGDRGGTGTFIVSGAAPVILMKTLYVGGRSTLNGTVGTLQYEIDAGGVSAITTSTSVILDAGGDTTTANLVVNLPGSAPTGNILLVNNTSATAVSGSFDALNGSSAIEGAVVALGGNAYILTYMYDSVSGTIGSERSATYNDIALIPVPGITISTPDTNTGDLLIAAVATDEDTSGSIAPVGQGWTLINCGVNGSAVTLGAWWKLAGASEPATHTFSWSRTNPQQAYGWMMRFTGQDPDNPINGTPTTADQTSDTPTSPAVTTTVNNCLILRLGAFDDNDITVGNPGLSDPCHTAITMDESGGSAGGTVSGGAGWVKQATAGSSGTSTFSLCSAKAARMITIAIAPDSTSGEGQIRP